jgi:haloalkane dehalogenase
MAQLDTAPALPQWLASELPWPRQTVQIQGRRIHYVDARPRHENAVVLALHGNPTWSYLWRKVIARLLPKGVRVIAPDLVGFGLSDKPRRVGAHSLSMHVETMEGLVEALELGRLTLVGQDWGGPIVAGVGARNPERVHGLVLANTSAIKPRRPLHPKPFHRFSHFPVVSDLAFRGLGFPLGVLDRAQGDRSSMGPHEKRAYAWPLRRAVDRAGPLALARMVPDSDTHPSLPLLDEIGDWVQSFGGPSALVWGTRDPILGRALKRHREALPQARVVETSAGHFLQEEVPAELADAIVEVAGGETSLETATAR